MPGNADPAPGSPPVQNDIPRPDRPLRNRGEAPARVRKTVRKRGRPLTDSDSESEHRRALRDHLRRSLSPELSSLSPESSQSPALQSQNHLRVAHQHEYSASCQSQSSADPHRQPPGAVRMQSAKSWHDESPQSGTNRILMLVPSGEYSASLIALNRVIQYRPRLTGNSTAVCAVAVRCQFAAGPCLCKLLKLQADACSCIAQTCQQRDTSLAVFAIICNGAGLHRSSMMHSPQSHQACGPAADRALQAGRMRMPEPQSICQPCKHGMPAGGMPAAPMHSSTRLLFQPQTRSANLLDGDMAVQCGLIAPEVTQRSASHMTSQSMGTSQHPHGSKPSYGQPPARYPSPYHWPSLPSDFLPQLSNRVRVIPQHVFRACMTQRRQRRHDPKQSTSCQCLLCHAATVECIDTICR